MAVAATGFFDGVHLGHREVIKTLLETAHQRGEQSLVITFWPHPRVVLGKDPRGLRLLSSLDEKRAALLSLGVDRVEVVPFTRDFAALTAAQYLDLLRREYGVTAIVLGYDNRFGSDQLSTRQIADLVEASGLYALVVSPHVMPDPDRASRTTDQVGGDDYDYTISSTKIRRALGAGEIEAANAMLGYEYSLSGVVVSGNMMGRTIGFPTANMKLREPLKCLPGVGAYLTRVEVEGKHLWGMTNIDHNEKIETNIFDFDEQIYGLDLKVSFACKLRDEIHFKSFDELKNQLEKDRESAKNIIFTI
ncbi:MAG: riboflavin biosynthesis protein RibF [Bacteroidales bacterium]|nr:riboflavin biosynthesis protein RibF [Bacteroidales bacterium]